jgi:hypothetical protein
MFHDRSDPCQAAGKQPQVGEKEPGGGTGGACFEVLGEASAAAEPGEAALDHPAAGQELKAFDAGRALDDLDRPGAAIGNRGLQLRAAIDAVGEDMGQLGEGLPQRMQQRHRAMRVLDIGWMHLGGEQEALGVSDDVALAPLDALGRINAARPPLSVVGTLWLSMMPTEGTRLRPACWRARATSVRLTRSQVPSSRQR